MGNKEIEKSEKLSTILDVSLNDCSKINLAAIKQISYRENSLFKDRKFASYPYKTQNFINIGFLITLQQFPSE